MPNIEENTQENTTQETRIYVCDSCSENINPNDITRDNQNNIYCDDCYCEIYSSCDSCSEEVHRDDWFNTEYGTYCESCYNNLEENNDNYINECLTPFKIEKSKTFKKNFFKNTCGFEIECYNKDHDKNFIGHTDLNKMGFSVSGDGSLNASGCEFKSNAFSGDLLFNKIDDICKILEKKKFYVNTECGLHIHIKVPKDITFLKKMALFYQKYESHLFNMLPNSRKVNSYCKKINQIYNLNGIENTKNFNDFKKIFYGTDKIRALRRLSKQQHLGLRYCWLNLQSYFYRGTLEIRSHSGTINADKIKQWFKIHLTLIDFISKLNLKTIMCLPTDENFFLSLFDSKTKDYIISRYKKFYVNENTDLKNAFNSLENIRTYPYNNLPSIEELI